ncbi:predicted protein [Naegleria gruberi]|uniref:Predicted protein n=1 Tax=Naegleria gruberi TaxID=5762 RepID=D2V2E1_NAEGR|nr:uncharacterized protein NAEGRDRAFT_62970 [Naegleria gruberi]EFC49041.1 predicted protein [Naegleria gruberi]|eukprot:XP_002681785.1 predicted protein [Naegleria gruberi strain NEG-M]
MLQQQTNNSKDTKDPSTTSSQTATESTSTGVNNSDKAADSLSHDDKIKLECETFLQSQLEKYDKQDWSDFSTAGRSRISHQMAEQIVFKQGIENFRKDNPLSTLEPKFKTKPNWFGYGVEVEMRLIEECPTNVGKPYIMTHCYECYFNGDGKLKYFKKYLL